MILRKLENALFLCALANREEHSSGTRIRMRFSETE